MQFIEPMSVEKFDQVCEAGADIFALVLLYLQRNGIPQEDAIGALTVALAGAVVAADATDINVAEGVEIAQNMWVIDAEGNIGFRQLPVNQADHSSDEEIGARN